jgi:hypothetical protein
MGIENKPKSFHTQNSSIDSSRRIHDATNELQQIQRDLNDTRKNSNEGMTIESSSQMLPPQYPPKNIALNERLEEKTNFYSNKIDK